MVGRSKDLNGQPDRQPEEGGFERWNTDVTTSVTVSLLGTELRLSQDPQSRHLGTTVRDASIVLAKWLERNARCLAQRMASACRSVLAFEGASSKILTFVGACWQERGAFP